MLDSLLIKNFRSLEHLEVPKLGRVNLMVGKNNCGKSTVLEALRIYAGNAQRPLLEAIARGHDERYQSQEGEYFDGEVVVPFQDFFTGRRFPETRETAIALGELNKPSNLLTIKFSMLDEFEEMVSFDSSGATKRSRQLFFDLADEVEPEGDLQPVFVRYKGDRSLPLIKLVAPKVISPSLRSRVAFENTPSLPCSVVPTDFISMDELADAWDAIALTDEEEVVKRALRIVSPDLESLVFVRADGSTGPGRYRSTRTAMVRLTGMSRPVPLNSMGDGMLRVLQLALKLFAAKGGFLLIDEFENGLHFSVQEKVWALLFEMAERHNIQIFATTHSWDCIESFTKVAVERTQIDGVLFRLGRSVRTSDKGRVIATVFDEAALQNITQADVEVR